MYVDRSLRVDPKKDKLIDELNFKKCIPLKRILKSKFFVGITNKQRKFIIHPEFINFLCLFVIPTKNLLFSDSY